MKHTNFKKWIIGAGVFNIVAASPLAMPFTHRAYYSMFNFLNNAFNLGGKDLVMPVEGVNMMFINTCGLALVLVGMLLIYASKDVTGRVVIPLLNSIVRLVFTGLLFYYVFVLDIARILILIAIIDVIIGLVFLYYIYKLKGHKSIRRLQWVF